MRNNNKFIIGATSTNTSGVSVLTAEFDTKGFSYARILCLSQGTGALSSGTNNKVEEGDTTASYATFAGAISGTDWTPSTVTNDATLAKMQYGIDLRGRKRYLKVTYTAATAALGFTIAADLSMPSDGISTSAEAGAANSLGI